MLERKAQTESQDEETGCKRHGPRSELGEMHLEHDSRAWSLVAEIMN